MQFLLDQGAMIAVLGMTIDEVENEINLFQKKAFVKLQMIIVILRLVVSGKKKLLKFLNENLKKKRKKEYFYQ